MNLIGTKPNASQKRWASKPINRRPKTVTLKDEIQQEAREAAENQTRLRDAFYARRGEAAP